MLGRRVRFLDSLDVLSEMSEEAADSFISKEFRLNERRLLILTGHEPADRAFDRRQPRDAFAEPVIACHPEQDPTHEPPPIWVICDPSQRSC